jgi:putative DNA primase/helicase
MLRLRESFKGREDHKLEGKLRDELPAILRWAIQGWRRLHERGRFQEPQASVDLRAQFEGNSSPVREFVAACCEVGESFLVPKDDLYQAYREYCDSVGRRYIEEAGNFGKRLFAAVPSLEEGKRPRINGKRPRCYKGIRLKETETSEDAGTEEDSHAIARAVVTGPANRDHAGPTGTATPQNGGCTGSHQPASAD